MPVSLNRPAERHQIIRLIPNKTAESVNQALTLLLGSIVFCPLLQIMVRSSNDCLRYFLRNISTTHMLTLHGRGSNENHNRLIRRWLPKGTKKTTPKEVAFIENWINNYPKNAWTTSHQVNFFWVANFNLKFGIINENSP